MHINLEGDRINDPITIYETIEELITDYGFKRFNSLVNSNDIDNDTLRDERAKARAAKEILSALRNALGYSVS